MAEQGVSNTALGAAVCRLIEQYQPRETRLFDDPVVEDLVGRTIRVMMKFASMRRFTINRTDAIAQGIYGVQVCRTRYIDDALQAALSKGIDQLVILGAGLDTRPYRLPGMEHVKVFEVDLPITQDDKKVKIQKHFGDLPEWVTFVPINFETQTLETIIADTTFDPSRPAVFIWEGVTQYITEEAVRQTLSFVGRSAPGSIIIFTYVLKSVIERRSDIPDANKMMDEVAKSASWIFGLEPSNLQAFLEPFHLNLQADVGDEVYQERYLKPLNRHLAVFRGERIAQAVLTHPPNP